MTFHPLFTPGKFVSSGTHTMIFVADVSGIFANVDVRRNWLLINISVLHMSLRQNVTFVKCKFDNKRLVDFFWDG
jgi:hypothetical protein